MSYANGRYPSSALAAIPGGRLRKDAALRWNAMCMFLRAHGRSIPMPNGAYSTYRDLAGQILMRRQWCARGACQNAAVPGNSNHGLGISVDTNQGGTVDSVPQFGFNKRYSDAPWESWHRTWGGFGSTAMPALKLGMRALRRGSKAGADVRQLKRLMRSKSLKPMSRRYFPRHVEINGVYGIGVRRGVRRFQRDHHMTVDGVVGPKTLSAIRHSPTRR